MSLVQNTQFNIIEPTVTLTLLPLNQMAFDLSWGDVQAAIEQYNVLDAETQNKLNILCQKLNKETPSVGGPSQLSKRGLSVGDLSSATFIELLSDTSRCSFRPQKLAQISILQQVIAAAQSCSGVAMESSEIESKSPTSDGALKQIFQNNVVERIEEDAQYRGEDLFDTLPFEMRDVIILDCAQEKDARALACTSSFFRDCLLGTRFRRIESELNQLNKFWGMTIAELPESPHIESEEKLRSVTHNTLVKLADFLLQSDVDALEQLRKRFSAPSLTCSIASPLHWLVVRSCDLLCSTDLSAQKIIKKILPFFQAGVGECAYKICYKSPSVKTLGPNNGGEDVFKGMGWIVRGLLMHEIPTTNSPLNLELALQFVNQERSETLRVKMLLDSSLPLLVRGHFDFIFGLACKLPPSEANPFFGYIVLFVLEHENWDIDLNDFAMKSVEKITDAALQQDKLYNIFQELLEKEKSKEALLIAPRILRGSSAYSVEQWSSTWCELIEFFMKANDPNQAFAVACQLDLTIYKHQTLASKLALMLIECDEYEKASVLTTKIIECSDQAFSRRHLKVLAKILAEKGKWKEVEDVVLQLFQIQRGDGDIIELIQQILAKYNLEYEQFEMLLFLAKKIELLPMSYSIQRYIIETVAKKGQWEEAMTLALRLDDDLRRIVLNRISSMPGYPYSSKQMDDSTNS